ncbi:hypothetical protein [Brevundimonas sp.]|uniref:hypothetical protein n=1 Tax=Brevundimonas sp. TaxID=1871086 RepID=UPI003D141EE8
MATAPKIPKEQRSFADHGALSLSDAADSDRRDHMTGVQSHQPGDGDVNLNEQGRFGNLSQNLTAIRNVQER